MSQLKSNHKMEYVILLDLLAKAISVTKVSSISDVDERRRLGDAHKLTNKFVNHASTVLYLSHGTVVRDLPSFKQFSFVDSASIDVLTRTAMEAFLVFHYVFFSPNNVEEKNYRYWCYEVAGLAERQNLPESIIENEQQKMKEKEILEEIRSKLESNIIFQGLTDSQKTRFFQGKKRDLWRWSPDVRKVLSWYDIGINAGFSDMLASLMYRHLSGSTHSSSLSVLQIAQALVNKETEKLIASSIDTMNVIIANMIQEYCGLFPGARDVLRDSGASNSVEVWVNIGRQLDED
ncbi:hypothetical protein ES703_105741 [subsurface metagenome]